MTNIDTKGRDSSVVEAAQMQAWVTAIASRDEQALAQLYEATLVRVYGLALRITRSRALDYLRKEDRAQLCEKPELLLIDEPAGDGDPQDLLSTTQKNHLLNQALQQLEPIQRQLVAMAFFRVWTGMPAPSYSISHPTQAFPCTSIMKMKNV